MVDFTIGNPMDLGNRKTTRILSWPDGSCRPASKQEIELWDEISRLQEQIETLKAQSCDPDGCKAHIDAFMKRAERAEAERDRLREALVEIAARPGRMTRGEDSEYRQVAREMEDIAEAAPQKDPKP